MKKLLILFLALILISLSSCKKTTETKVYEQYEDTLNSGVYYEIFVGGFSDSNGDGIGDLRGLINRLDYLNDGKGKESDSLNVDGLWLMPVTESDSYHKYDVVDYYNVDSDYGTNDDMKELVEEANKRGIDIIVDLVLNHTSSKNPWFVSAKKALWSSNLDNEYIDYYSIVTEDEKDPNKTYESITQIYSYECNFSTDMPELNLDNEKVREEIEKIIKYWLVDIGVKGFRLDAVKYFYLNDDKKNIEFLKWVDETCRKYKSDVYLVGEDWSADTHIKEYYEGIDCFNFGMSQYSGLIATTAKGSKSVSFYTNYVSDFITSTKAVRESSIIKPFISNHDCDRAAGYLTTSDYAMQMAANLYILGPGSPFIYYGEELGMKGSRGSASTDANRRLAMLWGDGDTVKDPAGATFTSSKQISDTVASESVDESSLLNYYKKLIKIRKTYYEMVLGTYEPISFDGLNNFGGFKSTYNGSTVYVFHSNAKSGDQTVNIGNLDIDSMEYIGEGTASYENGSLTIGPRTSVVIRVK